ncbi:unnamed protein product, partial [Meganyctiphanes norvegica]
MTRRGVICMRTVATFGMGFCLGIFLNVFLTVAIQNVKQKLDTGNEMYIQENIELNNESLYLQDPEQLIVPPYFEQVSNIGALGQAKEFSTGAKILCYLLVGPTTHKNAVHVRDTWGQRCDKILFFSTKKDPVLETVVLNVPEGYGFLWAKTKAAIQHLYKHYPDYDWFIKADDDTYVIVENLRFFLNPLDPKEPVYYGVRFKQFVKQGYMSGGGGYALSREAVKRFVTQALLLKDQKLCPNKEKRGAEDLQLGHCMQAVGVEAGDSRDTLGLPRFFSHSPMSLYYKVAMINRLHWYWKYVWYKHDVGPDCCSPHVISFHDIDPRMMWTLETLLYRIRIHHDLQPPAHNTSTSTVQTPVQATSLKSFELKKNPSE